MNHKLWIKKQNTICKIIYITNELRQKIQPFRFMENKIQKKNQMHWEIKTFSSQEQNGIENFHGLVLNWIDYKNNRYHIFFFRTIFEQLTFFWKSFIKARLQNPLFSKYFLFPLLKIYCKNENKMRAKGSTT